MNHSMEEFGEQFEDFLEVFGDHFPNDDMALQFFTEQYNQALAEGEDSFFDAEEIKLGKLLDEADALKIIDPKKSQKLLYQALELAPDDVGIKLALLAFKEPVEQLEGYLALEASEYKNWQAGPQAGWANLEERPYLHLKMDLAQFLIHCNMKRLAISHLEQLMEMNPNDNQGARYLLMSLYSNTEDYDKAKVLFEMEERYHHEDDMMIVPMMVVSVVTNHMSEAVFYFEMLMKLNPQFEKVVKLIASNRPGRLEEALIDLDEYIRPNSYESILQAFGILTDFIYGDFFADWMSVTYKNYQKKYAEEFATRKASQKVARKLASLEKMLKPSEALRNIKGAALYTLRQHGLVDFSDFKKKTEEQVAAINGIGVKTIQTLKENGVVFRKPRKK